MEQQNVPTAISEKIDVNYRWSFTARLHKAPKEIAAYYTQIKNSFLQYRKVKSRISWGCDTINYGREPLAKIVMMQKAMYVYLALDPKEYENTKYFFKDLSDKKKFEKVPMRIKVKSERGVRYVLELIEQFVQKYELKPSKTFVAANYALPNRSLEWLLKNGLVKRVERKQAAAEEEEILDELPLEEAAFADAVQEETAEPIPEETPALETPIAEPASEAPAQEAKPETVLQQHLEGSIEDIEAEQIHVQFLERLCKQFDADEINAHVKVVYKKKNEKKTSIFDVLMKRNK
jgi:predicted transport protein